MAEYIARGDDHFHSLVYREKVSHFHIIFTKTMIPAWGKKMLNTEDMGSISLPHNFHENYDTCSGNPMSKSIKMHYL
jgi:hypothetical protein